MSDAFEHVKRARDKNRPTSLDYIEALFRDFFELHGDRYYGDDAAIVGGVAHLNKRPVTVIGIEKGHTIKERNMRESGAPQPEGYRKAMRLMRQAEKFARPVICFVDTAGAYCGVGAEARGQGEAIATNLMGMMDLNVPVVTILHGEGGSGGALALAVSDEVWMLENAVYSVISPEGCASILWKDAKKAPQAAQSLRLTAQDALEFGFAERIISENNLGTRAFYSELEYSLTKTLNRLCEVENIKNKRYERFRHLGQTRTEVKA